MTAPVWNVTEQSLADGIYTIRLARPEKRNALSPELYHEIKLGVLRATGLPEAEVVLLEGSGGAFAAGGDLGVFLDLLERPVEEFIPAYTQAFVEPLPFRAILECPKPVVAKVDGVCVAGGLVIAAAADITIASDGSTFGVPEARVGLADAFCSTLLPLSVGLARARYMLMTAAMIDAATAADWGLILKAVPAEALDREIETVIKQLRSTSPEARRAYKGVANAAVPHMSAEAVLRPVLTANGREGLAAFVESVRLCGAQENR